MRALDLEVTAKNIYLILELYSNMNTYRTSFVIARGKLLQNVATYGRGPDRDRNALSEAGEALELFERIQRPNCPEALSIKTTVASCMMHMGEHEKVEGTGSGDVLQARKYLASCLSCMNEHKEAEQHFRTLLIIREKVLGVCSRRH